MAERACSPAAWSFALAEALWARFSPLTPYGKDAKERREVLSDREALELIYDRVEDLSALLAGAPPVLADRVAWHLKRLPRLPFSRRELEAASAGGPAELELELELIELFQVKKFLANYRGLVQLLDPGLRGRFRLGFESQALAASLDRGGSDPETFFVADCYHPGLPALRAAIADKDAAIRRARAAAKARARLERGLDFGERDFLLVPKEEAAALLESGAAPSFSVEAYDGRSCAVRIQDDPSTLGLEEERAALGARERELESEVVAALSREVSAEAARLLDYADAICDFDLARARAVLASELDAVRPRLGSAALVLEGGRFTPCEEACAKLGLAYTPLDARIEEGTAVLFGSNMGGKTVALQSLLFFQAMAQAGLFVPAARFETRVYARLDYVGELRSATKAGAAGPRASARAGSMTIDVSTDAGYGAEDADSQGGLSGFGFEIRSFAEAWEAAGERGSFVVLDEFARTTSSAEAEAILSAAVEAMVGSSGSRWLLATHFRGIARVPGARYLDMRGLDREAAGRAMLSGEPVSERIRRINRMMRYEIVEADEGSGSSDAIAIASLLGLDPRMAERAAGLYAARLAPGAARGKDT